uniref:Uncharacterized protein n=1 Tax=Phasianus colchicus TaxID=9054 RepID=A0A669P2Z9_PHACC
RSLQAVNAGRPAVWKRPSRFEESKTRAAGTLLGWAELLCSGWCHLLLGFSSFFQLE